MPKHLSPSTWHGISSSEISRVLISLSITTEAAAILTPIQTAFHQRFVVAGATKDKLMTSMLSDQRTDTALKASEVQLPIHQKRSELTYSESVILNARHRCSVS